MLSNLLPIIQSNAEYDLVNAIPLVESKEMENAYMHIVWEAFRVRGICTFLMECDAVALYQDLHRSGEAFLYYLQYMAGKDEKVTSQSLPFFDVIACADWESATNICRYSRHTYNSNEEYKDDFLYVYFLMKYFFLEAGVSEAEDILEDFEQNLGDEPDPRFDLCTSLFERNAQDFEEALCSMIFAFKENYSTRFYDGLISEEEWVVKSSLYIEGLALLRLAERVNIVPKEPEYILIPSLVRLQEIPIYIPNDWRFVAE